MDSLPSWVADPTPHAPDPNPWLSSLLAEPHAAYDPLDAPSLFPADATPDVRLARHLICAVLGAVAAVVLFCF